MTIFEAWIELRPEVWRDQATTQLKARPKLVLSHRLVVRPQFAKFGPSPTVGQPAVDLSVLLDHVGSVPAACGALIPSFEVSQYRVGLVRDALLSRGDLREALRVGLSREPVAVGRADQLGVVLHQQLQIAVGLPVGI